LTQALYADTRVFGQSPYNKVKDCRGKEERSTVSKLERRDRPVEEIQAHEALSELFQENANQTECKI